MSLTHSTTLSSKSSEELLDNKEVEGFTIHCLLRFLALCGLRLVIVSPLLILL
jgi:hypothetical protein